MNLSNIIDRPALIQIHIIKIDFTSIERDLLLAMEGVNYIEPSIKN